MDFLTLADVGRVKLEEVLGFIRDKVNIAVAGGIFGQQKRQREVDFQKGEKRQYW